MNLKKEDFYCGAFLSYLLNNGVKPALFDGRNMEGRKVYDFMTDKGDFRVYVKYIGSPTSISKKNNRKIWSFPFTEDQIDELKDLIDSKKEFYFCTVCGESKLNGSKLVVIDKESALDCIDLNRKNMYKPQHLKVRHVKGHWNFDIYGTSRADKKHGDDNTIQVKANGIDEIFGFQKD